MSAPVQERACLGDRVVTTTTHQLPTHDGVFSRGPGLYGTVTIEDFGGDDGAVYVEFVAANGKRWSMPLRQGEYVLVKRTGGS
jgi:hypothetical protein